MYPVYDAAGTIVDLSDQPTTICLPTPGAFVHAEGLLASLAIKTGWAGRAIVREHIESLYLGWCVGTGREPLPWNVLAEPLRKLNGGTKSYRRVNGKNRRVYLVPDLRAVEQDADLVDLEAARKRA